MLRIKAAFLAFIMVISILMVGGIIAIVLALGFIWLPEVKLSGDFRGGRSSNLVLAQNVKPTPTRRGVAKTAVPLVTPPAYKAGFPAPVPTSQLDDPEDGTFMDPDDNPAATPPETAASPAPLPDLGRVKLGPGITYFRDKKILGGSPALFNVLEIADVTNPQINLKLSLPRDKVQGYERVTDQLLRNGPEAVAAINGDFFDTAKPYGGVTINAQLRDGELTRTNEGKRPAVGIDQNGVPFMGVPRTSASLVIGNQARPIYRINYRPGQDQEQRRDWLVLWTPSFGPSTGAPVDGSSVALVVRQLRTPLPLRPNQTYTGTVEQVIENGADTPIPPDGVVLHGRGQSADFLRKMAGKGTILSFKVEMDEPWASARQILGGCNRLLADWVVLLKPEEYDCATAERSPRLPRTALAFQGKKVWLVTVDGRQPGYSGGANSDEFAQYLFNLGARNALNLDSGGSTTFVIRQDGKPVLVNRPSDGKERPVGNALMVIVSGVGAFNR